MEFSLNNRGTSPVLHRSLFQKSPQRPPPRQQDVFPVNQQLAHAKRDAAMTLRTDLELQEHRGRFDFLSDILINGFFQPACGCALATNPSEAGEIYRKKKDHSCTKVTLAFAHCRDLNGILTVTVMQIGIQTTFTQKNPSV